MPLLFCKLPSVGRSREVLGCLLRLIVNVYSTRGARPVSHVVTLAAAIGLATAFVNAHAAAASHGSVYNHPAAQSLHPIAQSLFRFVQDSDDDSDSEVPPDQVEKYVTVYKDMQRDRSLTVETAAAKEGLTVVEFRDLEQRVERDDAARDQVRTELQAAVQNKP